MNSYRKVKSVAKDILYSKDDLESKVLSTMKAISSIVGATLGPSGRPILLERQEYGLPHMFTKDGVTVFRYLGFSDPTAHAIMEAARDASVRTASEAGDGTTSATVLAEAIVRNTSFYCKSNPRISPQKVVRYLENQFKDLIEPKIKEWSMTPNEKMTHSVAKLSANGDAELADAVMECFDLIGDDGSITIVEQNGPSHYEVESLKGYPVSMGYEESCAKFFPLFLNDKANNRCFLEKPVFVLYFGSITEVQTVQLLMEKIGDAWSNPQNHGLDKPFNHNVILVATGFSENVLGDLANNFAHRATINVFPLLTPKSPIQNGEMHFLHDLSAIVGAKVFDPISTPLDTAELSDLGYGIQSFESTRYRSTILGLCDEDLVMARAEEVKNAMATAESKLDLNILSERLSKLTGGVAKLKVIGASNGELREKRDRAEDATYAVRGARKHGCLPGGGWTLMNLINLLLESNNDIDHEVLIPSLVEPVKRILENCGLNDTESQEIINKLLDNCHLGNKEVYDAWEGKFVDAVDGGILDSTPAVLEAIRNSISIASLLGTLGGTVVYKRDEELERKEAVDSNSFMEAAGLN